MTGDQNRNKHLRTTAEYNEYINSDAWNRIRLKVLRRDKHQCTQCGAKNRILQVHHKTYARLGRERLSDLITLCIDCHKEVHRRQNIRKNKAKARAARKRLKGNRE